MALKKINKQNILFLLLYFDKECFGVPALKAFFPHPIFICIFSSTLPRVARFLWLKLLSHGHNSCFLVAQAGCTCRFSAGTRPCLCKFPQEREPMTVPVGQE